MSADGTTCTKCSDYAIACEDNDKASSCAPGYVLNATTKKCESCGTNIATCIEKDKAVTCKDGSYKNVDACTGCTAGMAKCKLSGTDVLAVSCPYMDVDTQT